MRTNDETPLLLRVVGSDDVFVLGPPRGELLFNGLKSVFLELTPQVLANLFQ
jgi:hypothetical protein